MSDSVVADIRAFNRFYTRQLGLLNEHVAESRFALAEGRVLYEIAHRPGVTAGELATILLLDPAYLSRMVNKFAGLGLVALTPVPTDRRSNALSLTSDGEAAVAELEILNERAVERMIAAVPETVRADLAAAMSRIRALLGEAADAPLLLRRHRVGELGWLIHRQGLLYNRQFGWDIGFEALIAGIYRDFEEMPASPPKDLWIAERAGRILGSVFVIPFERSAEMAQLRMLYVEPDARGQGIGAMLVDQAVRFARDAGYRGMRLWTQASLVSARRLYKAAGFAMVEEEPHHSFGKDLVSEFWEIAF